MTAVYRIVQPYGRDKARDSTVISEHETAADGFAEIDRLSAQMAKRRTERCRGIDRGRSKSADRAASPHAVIRNFESNRGRPARFANKVPAGWIGVARPRRTAPDREASEPSSFVSSCQVAAD